MKAALLLLVTVLAVACSDTLDVPSPPSDLRSAGPAPVSGPNVPVATYQATLTASPSCAWVLPPQTRQRGYTATFYSNGHLEWTGQSIPQDPDYHPISSGTFNNASFSFTIDVDRPQSDLFYGLWDVFESGDYLTISGKAAGEVQNDQIIGTLGGLFAFYTKMPPNSLNQFIGHYCRATDHTFRFLKQ